MLEIYKVKKQLTIAGQPNAFGVDEIVALPSDACARLVQKGYLEVVEA